MFNYLFRNFVQKFMPTIRTNINMLFLKIVFSHLPFTAFALAFRVKGVPYQSHSVHFLRNRKKGTLCLLAYYFFKSIVSTLFDVDFDFF